MSKKQPAAAANTNFQCTVIGEEFELGSQLCQLLRIVADKERPINTVTLIHRGRDAGANMLETDICFFERYADRIPKDLRNKRFVFPETLSSDGRVRCVEYTGGDDSGWWCRVLVPVQASWDNSCVLVRLTPIVEIDFDFEAE